MLSSFDQWEAEQGLSANQKASIDLLSETINIPVLIEQEEKIFDFMAWFAELTRDMEASYEEEYRYFNLNQNAL